MSDLEQVKKELCDLKQLLTKKNGNGNGVFKGLQALIYIFVILIGMGVSWGVATAKLGSVEADVREVKARQQMSDTNIQNIQIKEAADDQILKRIEIDISEIKTDLKTVLNQRGSR